MNDLVHRLTNLISYNRFAVLAVLLSCALVIPACMAFKGNSPVTGKPEPLPVLELQEEQARREAEAILMKAAKARDVSAAALTKEFEARAAEINSLYETAVIDTEAKSANMAAGFEAARRAIADKEESVRAWTDISNQVVGVVAPGLAPAWATVTSLLAGGLLMDNRRKNKVIENQKGLIEGPPGTPPAKPGMA